MQPSQFGKAHRASGWRFGAAAIVLAAAALQAPGAQAAASPPLIVPAPASVQTAAGAFRFSPATRVVTSDVPAAREAAQSFVDLMRRACGVTLSAPTPIPAGSSSVSFRIDPAAEGGDEGYGLEVGARGVTISARTGAGLFYGGATLWQLISRDGCAARTADVPALTIRDQPRLRWRGLMIDSVRHYQSPETLKRIIDVMALHKLNVFHWHLTDDQGWRLEIKAFPKLTAVGAWRIDAGAPDIDPVTGKPRPYGGFYTQAQAREIVAYAAARHITVVPEIELPGHASAAVAVYPELGAGLAPAAPSPDWGILNTVYTPSETTFTFLQTVMDEVMAVFPSPFIHIGGDEVVKDEWAASPVVQARMRELGLYDEAAVHGYFTSRMSRYLHDHGRRAIGWDEVLESELPADTAVMSWRGTNGAVLAIRKGHDAVMAAAPVMYLDNRQSDAADEPSGRGKVISLKDVYDFDPLPAELRPEERKHLIGLQANLWTEHVVTDPQVEHMVFPRIAAVAETAWSPAAAHDWTGFVRRLQPWRARYAALGVQAASSAFVVRPRAELDSWTGKAVVTLANQAGVGEIRFTTNGAEPTAGSTLYTAPLVSALPARVRATAFVDGRPLAHATDVRLDRESIARRASQDLKTCTNRITLNLVDDAPKSGLRAKYLVDVLNPCWTYTDADLTGVTGLTVAVGQLPFNFQGVDREHVTFPKAATREGELEVRLDTCDGERIAVMPLAPAAANPAVTELKAALPPRPGRHDLCFTFTRPSLEPFWAIDWVQPTFAAPPSPPAPVRAS